MPKGPLWKQFLIVGIGLPDIHGIDSTIGTFRDLKGDSRRQFLVQAALKEDEDSRAFFVVNHKKNGPKPRDLGLPELDAILHIAYEHVPTVSRNYMRPKSSMILGQVKLKILQGSRSDPQ